VEPQEDPKDTFACEAVPGCPSASCAHPRRQAQLRGLLFAYDDGNGLWITSGESPFDLGFLGCICPQE